MALHALDNAAVFREYEPHELGADGYPLAWSKLEAHEDLLDAADMVLPGGVKDIVRQVTGHRCQRCKHPYYVGKGLGVWETLDGERVVVQPRLTDEEGSNAELVIEAGARIHWSPCDARCTHPGPFRTRHRWTSDTRASGWTTYTEEGRDAGERVRAGRETQAAYRILTVHHLNERKFDLRWWNLAALCQRCHLTIQRKVTMAL